MRAVLGDNTIMWHPVRSVSKRYFWHVDRPEVYEILVNHDGTENENKKGERGELPLRWVSSISLQDDGGRVVR